MLNTQKRNRKIFHHIESAIHDFCIVLECSYISNKEAIMVQHENEDLFYIYPEFNKNDYEINIVCMVYSNLPISKTSKLKEIYKEDEITEYLKDAESSLWFLDDTRLVMSQVIEAHYSDYAILKSKMLLEAYINVQKARKLKDKLEKLLIEFEQVSVN
jgi:hypothetical protein